MISEQGDVYNN